MQNTQSAVGVLKRLVPGIHFKLLNTRGEVCAESPSIVVTSDKEAGALLRPPEAARVVFLEVEKELLMVFVCFLMVFGPLLQLSGYLQS